MLTPSNLVIVVLFDIFRFPNPIKKDVDLSFLGVTQWRHFNSVEVMFSIQKTWFYNVVTLMNSIV